ncbi:MAG TPA: DUF5916 domain-containing protein [Longimicrobium sp.]|nr:DUF5916 domain-containing protein [Longimicrobium sp.]
MRPIARSIPIVVAVTIAAAALPAQTPAARAPLPAPRTFAASVSEGAIRVDAQLDEAAWNSATPIDIPYEYFPGDNTPAPVRTDCRITYDREALYLGCRAHDPEPRRIRANLTDRDAATGDDHITLMVDPFNDQRRAFQFRVNPLGVQMDATYSELEKAEAFSWDAIWSSAGRLTPEGYVVEAAIPFSSLRFPAGSSAQTWGVVVQRSYPRGVVHRLRSHPTSRNEACLLCQSDKLTGLSGIRPGRGVELTPTLTTRRSDLRTTFPEGRLRSGDVDPEFGVSGRWGIAPNVTLNATYNPDFSQVEADVAQLAVNERFALGYPEKRPFFLEGADFFQTPTRVVFTRSIVEPVGGAKLSGKVGSNAFGVFTTRDRSTSLLFPSNAGTGQALLDDDVSTAVVRYRRDVGAAGAMGVIYTGRMGEGGYQNHVAGVDGFFQLTPTKFVRVQAVRSETEYTDTVSKLYAQPGGGFGGNNLYAQFTHASRNWFASANLQEVGAGFRADAGFVPRADLRGGVLQLERAFWGAPNHWYRRLAFLGYAERFANHEGRETDLGFAAVATYDGPMQSFANVGLGFNRKYFAGKSYELVDMRPTFRISPTQRATFTLTGRVGEEIDFRNNRKAGIVQFGPGVDLRLGRRLGMGLGHTVRRLNTLDDDPAGSGRRILDVGLSQARVIYHFNVRTFVRGIVQYQDARFTPDLYVAPVAPEQRTLFSQLLFAYKVNPQTVVFAGYTDDRLGLETVGLTPTGRTLFLKLGYNWQP